MSEERYEADTEESDAIFEQFISSELPPKAAAEVASAEVAEEEEASVEEVAPEAVEDDEPTDVSDDGDEGNGDTEAEVPPVPAPAEPAHKVAPDAEKQALREALAYAQQQLQAIQAERSKQQDPNPAVQPIEFLQDDDAYGDALSSRESFNQLLNKVYMEGFAKARESVLQEIPRVVTPAIQQEITKATLLENWRRNNTDLLDKMDYVTVVAQQLAAQHQADPAWGWPELFRELGPAVRSKLGQSAPAKAKPAFAPAKQATRKPSPKEVSEAEKQLAWLFSNDEG